MTGPRISVLLPCFNDGRWLDEAVGSVLDQTCQDFEIIIVDDGSTDPETVRKLDGCGEPRARVFRTVNRGLPAARNYAAARATGKIFCALDADDRLAPTWFEKALAVLDSRPELAFVSHWLEAFGDETWTWRPERCDLGALLSHNTINGAALVRRSVFEAVGGYEESLREGCEDWDFWLRIVSRGFEGTIIPEVLFYYRRRPESMSRAMGTDAGYPRPFETLLQRHLPEFRRHVVDLLVSKEGEATRLRGEILKLQRDRLTVLEPARGRARELAAAIAAKRERLEPLSSEATRLQLAAERDQLLLERDRALGQVADAHALREADRQCFEANAQALERQVSNQLGELKALRQSLSWRMTSPLRRLYSWMRLER